MWSEDVEALHDMARRIGMRRSWFQEPPHAAWLHYDVTVERRVRAIALGALVTDRYGGLEHAARLRGDEATVLRIARRRERASPLVSPGAQLDLF